MASKKLEKGSAEWNMFGDFWKLCQKHWIPEDNDEYVQAMLDDVSKFNKKYRETNEEFALQLSLACIFALQERAKKMGLKGYLNYKGYLN